MTDPDHKSTVEAARILVASMDSLGGEMGALRRYGQRNRRLIWGLAVSLLLDVLLSVAVFFVAVQATEASNRATLATSEAALNRQSQLNSCEAANQARAVSIQLWNYVLDLSEKNNPAPDKQMQIDQFRSYIQDAYSPRDCTPPK
jgi:hypothetical protein